MVCVEVSNIFVIVYNEVSKEVCIMLSNMFKAGLCAWFNFPQLPQATQGKHNIAECLGVTCSKLPALRAEKNTNLALGMSRVAYGPGCPGVSQGSLWPWSIPG